jgi:hypothetical protein
MPPIMASIGRKSSYKVPHNNVEKLLAGGRTHSNRAFLWVRGGYYGLDYGKSKYYGFGLREVKILWVRIMGVTFVYTYIYSYVVSV